MNTLKVEVSKRRNRRTIDIAFSQFPFDKIDRDPVNVLYHKSIDGYRIFSLNKNNRPIRCWTNIKGISAVKSLYVSTDKFAKIVENLKPKIIFLNDGNYLNITSQNIKVYHQKTLTEILTDIEIKPKPINNESKNNIPTYADMQILDPKMTRKQYKDFIKKIIKV